MFDRVRAVVLADERAGQRWLDREHGVGVEILARGVEHVGRQRPVAGRPHDHVDVRRAPRVPTGGGQHRADRPVVRNRVGHGAHADECITTFGIGVEPAAQVIFRRLWRLDRVEHVLAVLPHVDLGAGDRRAVQRPYVTGHPDGDAAASGVLGHRLAVGPLGSARDVERAEHGRLRRPVGEVVIERIHEHRQAERVGPEDELLALVVGDVAGRGQDGDRPLPLRRRQLDVLRERVQVPDERGHQLTQAWVGAPGEARDNSRRDVRGLSAIRHGHTLARPGGRAQVAAGVAATAAT